MIFDANNCSLFFIFYFLLVVYETGQMLVFLLIAKGWTITRDTFKANEWRGVIIALSSFYMSNSIIIVLQVRKRY
jgi:hypothetical protein